VFIIGIVLESLQARLLENVPWKLLVIIWTGKQCYFSLNENREPANKKIGKQLLFFSTKKLRFKIPEEQRLNKPILNIRQQIIDDLNGKEECPYVHIDPHFDHAYEQ
jgi:hypothetical protein